MKKLPKNIQVPAIILVSIVGVFLVSRSLTYLILVEQILPRFLFLNLNGFRLHHFVYGNILIVITSFIAIVFGLRSHKNWFALFYGIGLGLVLDEFLLWMGDVNQLQSSVMWIPYSSSVVAIAGLIIASIIYFRLHYTIKAR